RNKYTLVLAPEGVPQLSVSYWAFAAPALLWLGATLLVVATGTAALRRGATVLRGALRSVNGRLAPPVAATIRRDARGLARAATLVALAVAFALSAATFNATYAQQAEVDAQLTNGADVTVNRPGDAGVAAQRTANTLAGIPGVNSVEQMQHRFAYVGNDLQDLYGINPTTIGKATTLQDAYFQGGSASQLMQRLQSTPSGVLVSAETVTDFNLHQGDTIRLRLRDAGSQRLTTIPFTYIGVANEFPTAPKDSFLVANAAYVARQTRDPSTGTYLVDTATGQEASVAAAARSLLGAGALVTDITQTRGLIGSSLTSVDLHGLTRVELVLAVLLVLASSALVMGLGVAERRRALAVASVLGAGRRQLTLMASSGAAVATAIGLIAGALLSVAMSRMLVKVLSGVFDPPPSALAIPWGYVAMVLASAAAAILAAALAARWLGRRVGVADLRSHD
ncbi:MAG TPA: ABC transporter permease, partial [Nocardioidaceae bacterium]|nr:ABC transporter permease [Nocardioidaceae bacterium]